MKLLLTAFIDGLKPESIDYMPFLNSLPSKRRVRTELGYSPTCYASMFSGVYPHKHLHWFTWQYSPGTSPYKWISRFKLDRLPHNIFTKYACYKITNSLGGVIIPWEGVMGLTWWYIPIRSWPHLDKAVKRHWSEPNFTENYPSLFDILTANRIPYEIVGLEAPTLEESSRTIDRHDFSEIKNWTYFFIGDIDPLSHRYEQDSPQTRDRLQEIDHILERKYELFERADNDFHFMLFSDHGHTKVNSRINLKDFFNSQGESLDDYIYFIDENHARFWFRNEAEKNRVMGVLSRMEDKGFVLTEEHLQKYKVNMPDNRYGDLIFYLDVPHIFYHGLVVAGKQLGKPHISAHGYLPDHPDSDGVLVSNKELRASPYVELVDIMPSVLDVFGIEIPGYIDGKVIWR